MDQYIRFCEISDEQRKQYGYTMKAVEETLRICCDENILMPFLASRQKEVQDIMLTLFNQKVKVAVPGFLPYTIAPCSRLP